MLYLYLVGPTVLQSALVLLSSTRICFISVLNLELCFLFWYIDELEVLHADRTACMFMNHKRTYGEGGLKTLLAIFLLFNDFNRITKTTEPRHGSFRPGQTQTGLRSHRS